MGGEDEQCRYTQRKQIDLTVLSASWAFKMVNYCVGNFLQMLFVWRDTPAEGLVNEFIPFIDKLVDTNVRDFIVWPAVL